MGSECAPLQGKTRPRLPLVSAIIPCYQQARFLPEAIETALGQSYPAIEVVVVDDGSLDDTAEVAARYPSIIYLRQSNIGLAGARNAGFSASRGEFICFLDADDRMTSNAFEAHLRCFSNRPESGFVVGDIDHINLDGAYLGSPRWPILDSNQYEELLRANHLANTIGVMFRRETLERLGGFDPDCSPAEDYELLLRAARLFPSSHHRTVVAQYRRHESSLSRKGTVMLRAMNHIMQLQWAVVRDDPKLTIAWRKGDAYWKDHFGAAGLKESLAYLRSGRIGQAIGTGTALIGLAGPRILTLPWRRRRRLFGFFRSDGAALKREESILPGGPSSRARPEKRADRPSFWKDR